MLSAQVENPKTMVMTYVRKNHSRARRERSLYKGPGTGTRWLGLGAFLAIQFVVVKQLVGKDVYKVEILIHTINTLKVIVVVFWTCERPPFLYNQ